MFKPIRDYYKTSVQFLNPCLRKPKMLGLLEWMSLPYEQVYKKAKIFFNHSNEKLNIQAQIGVIEFYLNRKLENWMTNTKTNWRSAYLSDGDFKNIDFFVHLEDEILNNQAIRQKICEFIDQYKMPGTRYDLMPFIEENSED